MRIRLLILGAIVLLGALLTVATNQPLPAVVPGFPIVEPDSEVKGLSHAEWHARQWQWTLAAPIGKNPGQDVSGATCDRLQPDGIVFIPRNFAPCTVPGGNYVVVPIIGAECSTVEPPPYHGDTDIELASCVKDEIDRYATIIVRVDGTLVPDIDRFRKPSIEFFADLPPNNILGLPATEGRFVADGYLLILTGLAPGEHQIVVHLELADGTVLPDKVLNLTVT